MSTVDKNTIRSWDQVPEFNSEEEEHHFWATHSLEETLLEEMDSYDIENDPSLYE